MTDEQLDELRGYVVGIDGLARNAMAVAEGECAMRLNGLLDLTKRALTVIGYHADQSRQKREGYEAVSSVR